MSLAIAFKMGKSVFLAYEEFANSDFVKRDAKMFFRLNNFFVAMSRDFYSLFVREKPDFFKTKNLQNKNDVEKILEEILYFCSILDNGKSETDENPDKIKEFEIDFIFTNGEKIWEASSFGEIRETNYTVIRHYYEWASRAEIVGFLHYLDVCNEENEEFYMWALKNLLEEKWENSLEKFVEKI